MSDEDAKGAMAWWADVPSRAGACHLALLALRGEIEARLVIVCRLAWEIHDRGWWSGIRRTDGRLYESEESYFTDVLGVDSYRSAARRIAVGRALAAVPEAERAEVETAVAEISVTKASIVAAALEAASDGNERARWIDLARRLPARELQAEVTRGLEAKPKGRPADALYRVILNALSSVSAESAEVVERFFAVGKRIGAGRTTAGILVAGMMEALSSWEPAAGTDP